MAKARSIRFGRAIPTERISKKALGGRIFNFFKKKGWQSVRLRVSYYLLLQWAANTLGKKLSKKHLTISRRRGKIVESPAESERQRTEAIRWCSLKTKQCRNESSIWFKPDVHQEESWWNIDCELQKQSTISLCGSKESYPKIKRANQRLSVNLKSDFH